MAYNAHRRARVSTIAQSMGVDEAELCRRLGNVKPTTVVMVSKALTAIRELQR